MDSQTREARTNAKTWLQSRIIDAETRNKIEDLLHDSDSSELIECFHKKLDFGTGGLRAIMGVGSNRINRYTIGLVTQGLSEYLKKSFPGEYIKVAIAYDSRHKSDEFASIVSQVLSANGIFANIFSQLRPTPLLSFAVRYLKCHAGIVITASHNTKEYNGYKVYWQDGGQLLPPHDTNIVSVINSLSHLDQIRFQADGSKIKHIDGKVEEAYFEQVQKILPERNSIKRQEKIPIVYSSLHGSGITMVPKCLSRAGFSNCIVVEEQEIPDGDFPTVGSPNPEYSDTMAKSLALAKAVKAELVLATDPDADRVGVGIREKNGDFLLLNGNQALSLMVWFILKNQKKTQSGYIVKTIVTTDLVETIATRWGVECYSTLTGFKYIAAQISKWEGKKNFFVAGEESYGFLLGDFVRDKDAVSACMFFAYMAALAKDKGETLYDWLMQLYVDYGLYQEELINLVNPGLEGKAQIKKKMDKFRTSPPVAIDSEKVVRTVDFQAGEDKDMNTGVIVPTSLPRSDVLQFYTKAGSKVSIRPSGTEPKIKFYISVQGTLKSQGDYKEAILQLRGKIKRIKGELLS